MTTYLADHLYEEQKGKGMGIQKTGIDRLRKLCNKKNEFPVREFRGRFDSASKAIGYGKTALIFHMLKKMTGEDVFYRSLRESHKREGIPKGIMG